jgi:mannose-6-phosphate isomerase
MAELYPLLMRPQFHKRVWGARSLRPIYDQEFDEPVGEAWLTGDDCKVANGPLAGKTLGELCKQFGADLVGESAPVKDRFPLLIKFLFPREKLSVQVHPDDEMARRLGQPNGKTECWYVLHAEPGAQVGVGLRPGTTKVQFAEAIKQGSAEQLLNWIDVAAGDLIYVEAGTVHAIGPGSILVETQQNSDITFRLYDYGRPRELHLKQGLEAMKEKTGAGKAEEALLAEDVVELVSSHNFVITRHDRFGLSGAHGLHVPGHTHGDTSRGNDVIVCIKGEGFCTSRCASRQLPEVKVVTGEAVIVPAAVERYTVVADENSQFLSIKLPHLEGTCRPS